MQQVRLLIYLLLFPNMSAITSFLKHRLWWCYTHLRHCHHILPTHCLLCQDKLRYGQSICTACSSYFSLPELVCTQCASPLTQTESPICLRCHITLPAYDQTIAATTYQPPADNLVIKLKYHGKLAVAQTIAYVLQQHVLHHQTTAVLPDLLCPVPLSRQRLAERGYNQAVEIAKPLSGMLGIPLYARLCQRHRHTSSQAQLSAAQRQTNLHQAFSIPQRFQHLIAGKHIGVIDDVMTTGETLHEIAMTLKAYGAVRVTNIVFARTVAINNPIFLSH